MASVHQYRIPKAAHRGPKTGTEVVISGLLGRKQLNGMTGTVVPHLDGTTEDATYRVRVQMHGTSHTVKVLPRNVTKVSDESRIDIANRIEVTETPSEDHLVLPTSFKLNIDKGHEVPLPKTPRLVHTNRICTAKGNQSLGETYARIQESAAGRDPGRLRHRGLDFFRDNAEEEAHPASNKIRSITSRDTFMHTMRTGYDWRKNGSPQYTDPFHIPVAQGGHAAHLCIESATYKDIAEGEAPLHPRLRGLLLNEELDPEDVYEPIERGYRDLLLFTGERQGMRLREVGGPLRCAAQKERDFKRKEASSGKLLEARVALSVKPAEDRSLPPPMRWDGAAVDGTWDPMGWELGNNMLEADATDSFTLKHLLDRPADNGHQWDAVTQEHPLHVHQMGRGGSPEPLSLTNHLLTSMEEAPARNIWNGSSNFQHQQNISEVNPEALLIPSPWSEEVMNEMLRKSAEDAEKGFDYGSTALGQQLAMPLPDAAANAVDMSRSADDLPWYEKGVFASSMLVQNSRSPTSPMWSGLAASADTGANNRSDDALLALREADSVRTHSQRVAGPPEAD